MCVFLSVTTNPQFDLQIFTIVDIRDSALRNAWQELTRNSFIRIDGLSSNGDVM
jgi:hypothetical protein